jgi:hypothetical protein
LYDRGLDPYNGGIFHQVRVRIMRNSHTSQILNHLLGALVPAIVLPVAIVIFVARSTFDDSRVYSRGRRIGE